MAKIFKEHQEKKARKALFAICALHDMNCSTEYIGERTLITDEERQVLRQAQSICIKVVESNKPKNNIHA